MTIPKLLKTNAKVTKVFPRKGWFGLRTGLYGSAWLTQAFSTHTQPMMITTRYHRSLLALTALFASTAMAQEKQPVSRIHGSIGVQLATNRTYVLAVPFVTVASEGLITSVSGTTLGVNTTLTPAALTNHSIRILTRVNPSSTGAYGKTVQIDALTPNTASQVTTTTAITPEVGDGFVIVQNHTLSSLLGSGGSVQIQSGSSPSLSDVVYVESAGVFTGYWHFSTGGGWRLLTDTTGAGADQGNVAVQYNKGLTVVRKAFGGTKTVRISGEAIDGRFSPATTTNQISLINNPFTKASTLGESGIDKFISKGSSVSLADNVYVSTSTGLVGCWFKTGTGWRLLTDTAGTGADQAGLAIDPGLGFMIRDRSIGGTGFAIEQPFAE